jgi:hypothetical protein
MDMHKLFPEAFARSVTHAYTVYNFK